MLTTGTLQVAARRTCKLEPHGGVRTTRREPRSLPRRSVEADASSGRAPECRNMENDGTGSNSPTGRWLSSFLGIRVSASESARAPPNSRGRPSPRTSGCLAMVSFVEFRVVLPVLQYRLSPLYQSSELTGGECRRAYDTGKYSPLGISRRCRAEGPRYSSQGMPPCETQRRRATVEREGGSYFSTGVYCRNDEGAALLPRSRATDLTRS